MSQLWMPVVLVFVSITGLSSQAQQTGESETGRWLSSLKDLFSLGAQDQGHGQGQLLSALDGILLGQQPLTGDGLPHDGQGRLGMNISNVDLVSLLGLGVDQGLHDLLVGPAQAPAQGPSMVAVGEGETGPQLAQEMLPSLVFVDATFNATDDLLGKGLAGSDAAFDRPLAPPGPPPMPRAASAQTGKRRLASPLAPGTQGRRQQLPGELRLSDVAQRTLGLLTSPVVKDGLERLLGLIPTVRGSPLVDTVKNTTRMSGLKAAANLSEAAAAASDHWATLVPPGVTLSGWKRSMGGETVSETGFVWDSLMAEVAVVRAVDPGVVRAGYTQAATLYDFGQLDTMVAIRTGLSGADNKCYLLPSDMLLMPKVQSTLTSRNDTLMPPPTVVQSLTATTPRLSTAEKIELFTTYPSLTIFCEGVEILRARPSSGAISGNVIKETERMVKVVTLDTEVLILVPKTVPTAPAEGAAASLWEQVSKAASGLLSAWQRLTAPSNG